MVIKKIRTKTKREPLIKRLANIIERKKFATRKFLKTSSYSPISSKRARVTRAIHTPLGIITKKMIVTRTKARTPIKSTYYLKLPRREKIIMKAEPRLKKIISSQFGKEIKGLTRSEREYLIRRLQEKLKQKKILYKIKPIPAKKIKLKTQIKKATNINKIIRRLPL